MLRDVFLLIYILAEVQHVAGCFLVVVNFKKRSKIYIYPRA